MSYTLAASFLRDFVRPLVRGADVAIARPLGWQGTQHVLQAAPSLVEDPLAQDVAKACVQRLLAQGILPPPLPSLADDAGALSALAALHDLLFLARPEAQRLSSATRDGVLREVIVCAEAAALSLAWSTEGQAEDATILHRHALIEPLFRLTRLDLRRKTLFDETVQRGLTRKKLASAAAANQDALTLSVLCWTELPGVVDGQGAAALQALLACSPLTALWSPRPREAISHEAHAQLLAQQAPLLLRPGLARGLSHRYLSLGVPAVAAALSGPLVVLLQQAADDAALRPAAIGWLGFLSQLHWLAYIALPLLPPPRLDLSEDSAPWFALFYCLSQLAPAGRPAPAVIAQADPARDERALYERAQAHAQRCRSVLPAEQLASLHRLLTRALATSAQ